MLLLKEENYSRLFFCLFVFPFTLHFIFLSFVAAGYVVLLFVLTDNSKYFNLLYVIVSTHFLTVFLHMRIGSLASFF
ncbi:hypothetical protein YC2023_088076 [Brassica napus]